MSQIMYKAYEKITSKIFGGEDNKINPDATTKLDAGETICQFVNLSIDLH
jgi:hypothetical protein